MSAGNCLYQLYRPQPEADPQKMKKEADEAGRCCGWSANLVVAAPVRHTPMAGWVVLGARTWCALGSDILEPRSYDLTVTRSGFLAADYTDSTTRIGAIGPLSVRDSEAKQNLKSCVFICGFATR